MIYDTFFKCYCLGVRMLAPCIFRRADATTQPDPTYPTTPNPPPRKEDSHVCSKLWARSRENRKVLRRALLIRIPPHQFCHECRYTPTSHISRRLEDKSVDNRKPRPHAKFHQVSLAVADKPRLSRFCSDHDTTARRRFHSCSKHVEFTGR